MRDVARAKLAQYQALPRSVLEHEIQRLRKLTRESQRDLALALRAARRQRFKEPRK